MRACPDRSAPLDTGISSRAGAVVHDSYALAERPGAPRGADMARLIGVNRLHRKGREELARFPPTLPPLRA